MQVMHKEVSCTDFNIYIFYLRYFRIEPVALQDFFITFFANKTGILYKLHVFGISIVLVFPFTRLIHIIFIGVSEENITPTQ